MGMAAILVNEAWPLDDILEYFSYFPQEKRLWHFMQIISILHEISKPVSGKNKKNNINLSSAEFAHIMVKVRDYMIYMSIAQG